MRQSSAKIPLPPPLHEKLVQQFPEIDYLDAINARITPIEIKAGTKGGMKSLWLMMREKGLTSAYRCSLENFGELSSYYYII